VQRATLFITHPFGLLSILACLCVLSEATADWRAQGNDCKIVTRIQVFLQIPLCIMSLVFGLSSLFMSRDFGNDETCQIQGGFAQFALIGGIGMDMSLSLVYLLIIKCAWQERQFRAFEKWFHIITWPSALVPAIYLYARKAYANTTHLCWIAACHGDTWCAYQHRIALLFQSGVHVLSLLHMIFSIYVICQVFQFATGSQQQASRMVARRGMFYAGGMLVVQLPFFLVRAAGYLFGFNNRGLSSVAGSTIPLAGFLNMLVFMMGRREMRTGYGWMWRRILDFVCFYKPPEAPRMQLMSRDLFATTVVEEGNRTTGEEQAPATA